MDAAQTPMTSNEKRKAWVAKWPRTWLLQGDRLAEQAALAELRIELKALLAPSDVPRVFLAPHPKALKIGIDRDLVATFPRVAPDDLTAWLGRWTKMAAYIRRVGTGTNRHDLKGNEKGKITVQQRIAARTMLVGLGLAEHITADEFEARTVAYKAKRDSDKAAKAAQPATGA